MNKIISLTILAIFVSSCSMMKSKTLKQVERTIASIEPNQLKVDEIEGRYFVSINFEVLGKHKGNNTFEIKAPFSLDNDIKHRLPYEIIVNSSDINCLSNSSYKEIHKNYQYRNEGLAVNNNLKCVYEGLDDRKIISATYVFHKLDYLKLQDANQFIHPITNADKDATRILKMVKEGQEVNFFDRKLLFNVFANKQIVSASPKINYFSFHLKLDRKDIIQISKPHGEVRIPKIGDITYKGKSNKKYSKKYEAGKRFLVSEGVRPYELVCSVLYARKKERTIERFEWNSELQISSATDVKCGLNTKKLNKKELEKISGEVKYQVAVVKYDELYDKTSKYLVDPQKKLNTFVDELNKSNLDIITSYANRTIDLQVEKVKNETSVSKYFPFTKSKELRISKIYINHKPKISKIIQDKKIYHYLDYDVYASPDMIDENDKQSSPGKIFLGTVQTKYKVESETQDLSKHEFYSLICGKQYEENFLPMFVKSIRSNKQGEKESVDLSDYKSFIEEIPRRLCSTEYSGAIETTLRRKELNKCGDISKYKKKVAREVEELGEVTFNKVVAAYDLYEGVHSDWGLDFEDYVKEELPIKTPITVKSDKKIEKINSCMFITDERAIQLLEQ